VTSPDLGESDLARCTDADWQKVRECLPVVWNDESNQPSFLDDAERIEIWWLLLLGVLALLCVEVWMTRRLALARGC
jgi:hypothetical protein